MLCPSLLNFLLSVHAMFIFDLLKDTSSNLPTPDSLTILCLRSRPLATEILYGKNSGAPNLVKMRDYENFLEAVVTKPACYLSLNCKFLGGGLERGKVMETATSWHHHTHFITKCSQPSRDGYYWRCAVKF